MLSSYFSSWNSLPQQLGVLPFATVLKAKFRCCRPFELWFVRKMHIVPHPKLYFYCWPGNLACKFLKHWFDEILFCPFSLTDMPFHFLSCHQLLSPTKCTLLRTFLIGLAAWYSRRTGKGMSLFSTSFLCITLFPHWITSYFISRSGIPVAPYPLWSTT